MLRSLNNFQKGTTFPYTASASGGMTRSAMGGMGCGRMDDGELPDGVRPLDGSDGLPDELPGDRTDNPAQHPESDQLTDADWANGRVDDGIRRNESAETAEAAIHENAEHYIAALNGAFPPESNTAPKPARRPSPALRASSRRANNPPRASANGTSPLSGGCGRRINAVRPITAFTPT